MDVSTRGVPHPLQAQMGVLRLNSEPEPARSLEEDAGVHDPRRLGLRWPALGVQEGHQSRSDSAVGEVWHSELDGPLYSWPQRQSQAPACVHAHPLANEEPAFVVGTSDAQV